MYDVVIVGGGPAGLSAALVLGRCRRRVLLCDTGEPRNARTRALHGYLSRDGIAPLELLRLGHEELHAYDIAIKRARVIDVATAPHGFTVTLDSGERCASRTVLLATGVRDELPTIPGIDECYGVSVHHCPYCDGWEVRDKTIAVVGSTSSPVGLALSLRTWSDRIIACTNGQTRVPAIRRRQLADKDIPLYEARISRIDHADGWVRHIEFTDGQRLSCDAIFFTAPQTQQSDLAKRLGCEFNRRGTVKTDALGHTCVHGIYVVGDASRDVQFVVVAAAEGAKAGVAINQALQALPASTGEESSDQSQTSTDRFVHGS